MTGSALILNTYAQQLHVFEEWATSEGVQEFFYKNVTVTDASQNVYVAGATLSQNGDYDLLLTKYDRRGLELWKDTIAGPGGGHDFATDLVVDGEGNIVVCGSISQGGTQGQNMLVVKYDPDGFEYWRYSYDHDSQNDAAASVSVNSSNRIFVTGATQPNAGFADILTINLNSDGTFNWAKTFDYDELHDIGVKITATGNDVYVTGIGQTGTQSWRALALKYNQSNGVLNASAVSGSGTVAFEEVRDMVIDDSGNIYLVGSTLSLTNGMDLMLIKLDEDLDIQWTKTWDGSGQADHGHGVRVAPNGDVYVCGTTQTGSQGTDVVLVKYNAAGNLIWSETYNGAHNGDDEAASLEWHDDGYLYVAGSSFVVSSLDYLTLKYDTTGALQWNITYNSPHNKDDRATNMAMDDEGDIIVSGQCEINDSTTTYYTVKYVEHSLNESILAHIGERSQGFMKQMGQLNRTDSLIAHEVKYYSDRFNHKFYSQDGKLSYVVASTDSTLNFWETDSISFEDVDIHRIDLEFLNGDSSTKARGFEPLSYYSNHYFPHCAPGVVRIPHLEILYYNSIWSGIDLYLSASKNEEYTFVLDVSAKPEDIKFNAVGADSILLLNNGLNVSLTSAINDIDIGDFKAYQADSYGDLEELSWQPRFEANGSIISFDDFGVYNTSIPLVISNVKAVTNVMLGDICWSTFLGGSGEDFPLATAVNNDEFALAGWSTSVSDFPENPSTFTSPSYYQGVIAKFNQEGEILWSILYGGNGSTMFADVAFDNNDHVLVAGYTLASNLVTLASGDAYLQSETFGVVNGYGSGAFIAEFPSTGDILIWGTYFGGIGYDLAHTIEVDENNHKYIAGEGIPTFFPLEEGDYGAYFYDGNANPYGSHGVIARFNDSNSLIWSTFIEGSRNIADLMIKGSYNIAILGGTNTNTLPVVNGGGGNALYNESLSGNTDIIYGILNPSGQFEHLTYIGGNGSDGIPNGVQIYSNSNKLAEDSDRHTYLIGYASDGLELQPQGNYYFSDDHTQAQMPFVYKIDDVSYELKYGSYLYDVSSDCQSRVSSISIDMFDNMIVSSFVHNIAGNCDDVWPLEPLNGGYFQDEIYANSNSGHFLIQNEFQGVLYATYLGGSEYDYISNAFMLNENLFLVGVTLSDNTDVQFPLWDPETDAYFQGNIPGLGSDIFLTKICTDFITDVGESSIPKVKEEFPFAVFPNPALSEFTVLSLSADVALSEIDLLDIRGKLIRNYELPNRPLQQTIPVADLSTGIYIVRIRTNDDGYYNHKLVVK